MEKRASVEGAMFSEPIADALIDCFGELPYFAFVLFLMGAVPVAIGFLALIPLVNGTRGPSYGVAMGFAVALWASLCALCVPWCGLYPNLPGSVVALAAAGDGGAGTWLGQVCIHGTNLVLWPILGWVAFRGRQAEIRRRR
jgi:hypothetical protein